MHTNEQLFGEKSRARQPIPAPRVQQQYPQMYLEKQVMELVKRDPEPMQPYMLDQAAVMKKQLEFAQ